MVRSVATLNPQATGGQRWHRRSTSSRWRLKQGCSTVCRANAGTLSSAQRVEPAADVYFNDGWSTYQQVVASDALEHRALLAAARQALLSLCKGSISLLDLGCGDASPLAALLRDAAPQVHLHAYTGVDLSLPALELARRNMRPLVASAATDGSGADGDGRHHVRLLHQDMLSFLQQAPAASFDVAYSAFAVHHLDRAGKQAVLQQVARVLRPGGCFVYIDVFLREDTRSRCEYMALYLPHILRDWTALPEPQREQSVVHVASSDYPEAVDSYRQWSEGLFSRVDVLHKGQFSQCLLLVKP